MKHPSLIALAALAALTPMRSSARDFSYTYEGQTLTYTVLDEDTKTVETKQGLDDHAGNEVTGDLVLPSHPMDGEVEYTLTTIGKNALYFCNSLTSVEIPNSVTTIENYAFCGCSSLTSVEIPNSVITIKVGGFQGCTALTNVEIPNSVTTIEGWAFSFCTALSSIEIPNSITTIIGWTFKSCSALTSVRIPDSVTNIGNNAFEDCSALTSIDIPNSVTDIQVGAFSGCNALTEINVGSGNQSYSSEDGVLFDYDKKALIMYPEGKEGPYTIPNSVTSIGESAFSFCKALTSVEIPNSVTAIGSRAFCYCTSLTSVEIPSSVTTIGFWAFCGCSSLTSVKITNSETCIAEWAFGGCSALKNVTCLATIPPIIENGAFGKNEDSYLYVPAASVSAYENSDWAQYFTGIKAIKDELTVEIAGNGKVYGSSLDAIESGSVFGGSQLSFLVLPEAGSRIEAITMDGEDAMDKLTGNKLTVHHNPVESVLSIEFAPESEATLTVKGGDSYAATYTYTAGTAATVKIQPESGWKVSTVSYNGADVTDQLEGNVYVTAPLEGENSLNFVLEKKNPTGVDEVGAPDSRVRVSVWHNTVTITGLEPGAQVSVYDMAGNMVYTDNEHSLTLPSGQAYIVSTPSKTFKVVL